MYVVWVYLYNKKEVILVTMQASDVWLQAGLWSSNPLLALTGGSNPNKTHLFTSLTSNSLLWYKHSRFCARKQAAAERISLKLWPHNTLCLILLSCAVLASAWTLFGLLPAPPWHAQVTHLSEAESSYRLQGHVWNCGNSCVKLCARNVQTCSFHQSFPFVCTHCSLW